MASGIGETLRVTRTQQRLSLAEAAAEIRVREPYLAALEEERFGKLGGDVYVRAFLRGYSEYLGLDPDQVVEAYRREHEGGDEGPRAVTATATAGPPVAPVREPGGPPPLPQPTRPGEHRDGASRDQRGAPMNAVSPPAARRWEDDDDLLDDDPPRSSLLSRALIGAGVILLVLVGAVVVVQRTQQRDDVALESTTPATAAAIEIPTPQSVAPAASPPTTQQSPAASAAPSPQPTPQASATPAPAPPPASTGPLTEIAVELTVLPAGPSWLRATADGSVAEQDTFQPGTTLSWTAEEELELRIGDCSKVRLVLNGVDQALACAERETRDITYRIGEPT